MATTLFSEIEFLKGVGKARGEKYRKLGINSPAVHAFTRKLVQSVRDGKSAFAHGRIKEK